MHMQRLASRLGDLTAAAFVASWLTVSASGQDGAVDRADGVEPSRPSVTWVVDDDGAANFSDLPEAVLAASDGDTLVLRPGRYRAASVHGKGLRIVGAGASSTVIEQREQEGPFFAASGLARGQALVLAKLTGIGRGRSLELTRLHGPVVLADLVVDGRDGARGPYLDQCLNAFLSRVAVVPSPTALDVGDGLTVSHGNYTMTQVVALGSRGVDAKSPRGRARTGGSGLAAIDATVESALSEWVGGDGGAALWDVFGPFCPEAATAGAGGAAIAIAGRSSLRVFGDGHQHLVGGTGGAATRNPWEPCWSFAGDGGPALRLAADIDPAGVAFGGIERSAGLAGVGEEPRVGKAGVVVEPIELELAPTAPPWPTLSIDSVSAVGGQVKLRVFGMPGDRITLLIGQELVAVTLKKSAGFRLHVGAAGQQSLVQPAPIGASGTLAIALDLPGDAALVGQWFAVQALVARRQLVGRATYVTNCDVLVVGDGLDRAVESVQR